MFKKKIAACISVSLFTMVILFSQTAFAISPVNVEKVSRVTGATP